MDSLYVHDPVLITDAGAVILQTGKVARRGEGPAMADALKGWGVPILGVVEGDATAEAGDMIWLDSRTLLVGRGFRTNQAGIDRLSSLLRPLGVTVIPVPLPYWTGPEDVLAPHVVHQPSGYKSCRGLPAASCPFRSSNCLSNAVWLSSMFPNRSTCRWAATCLPLLRVNSSW